MRLPCLSCLPALLLLFAISGMTPCIQAQSSHGHPDSKTALLSADGLLCSSTTMTTERGIKLLAGFCLVSAVLVWPRVTCRNNVRQPYRTKALPGRTGFRGLLPLPASPPCLPGYPETVGQSVRLRLRMDAGTFSASFRHCPPYAGSVQTTASAPSYGQAIQGVFQRPAECP